MVLVTVGVVAMVSLGGDSPCTEAAGEEPATNRQQRLTTTEHGVEIELWSAEPFPVRALPPMLRIGSEVFSRSRYPDNGRLDTLLFLIPANRFETLTSDDSVVLYYGDPPAEDAAGVGTDGWSVWTFGNLRKGLLDCPVQPA